jgi:hypothetical protein
MKRSIRGLLTGAMAIQLLPGGAWGAGCASQADLSALKIAALQQELMVAALSCHDIARYNDFVLSHQPELFASDANLKAFFTRHGGRHGEAGYHTYKTELANAASLNSLHDDTFCDRAGAEFDASSDSGKLSAFVDAREWAAAVVYPLCPGVATSELVTASAAPPEHGRWHAGRHDRTEGAADDAGPSRGLNRDARDRSMSDERDGAFYAPHPHGQIDDSR